MRYGTLLIDHISYPIYPQVGRFAAIIYGAARVSAEHARNNNPDPDMTIPSSRSIALLFTAAACIAGCTSKTPEAGRPRDTVQSSVNDSGDPTTTVPAPSQEQFKSLEFKRESLAKEYIYQGQLLGGAHWIDRNGDNTLLVSQKQTKTEEGSKQEIFGYNYVMKDGATKLLWKIQDAAENWCDAGDGLVSDIVVLDLDGDEVAENAFIYNIQGSCDVSPRTFKLMLHSGEKKLAVRGTNVVNPGGEKVGGEKKLDAAFDTAPKEFKQYAAEMWAKYVR